MLHEDGRIIEQRDYYDLWGDIFNGIPYFKRPYRRFMRKVLWVEGGTHGQTQTAG